MTPIGGAKRYAAALLLGASAPLVVMVILAQRAGRARVIQQTRRLKKHLGPHVDRVVAEREEWRSDLSLGEVVEWALQSPLFGPRPKS